MLRQSYLISLIMYTSYEDSHLQYLRELGLLVQSLLEFLLRLLYLLKELDTGCSLTINNCMLYDDTVVKLKFSTYTRVSIVYEFSCRAVVQYIYMTQKKRNLHWKSLPFFLLE